MKALDEMYRNSKDEEGSDLLDMVRDGNWVKEKMPNADANQIKFLTKVRDAQVLLNPLRGDLVDAVDPGLGAGPDRAASNRS